MTKVRLYRKNGSKKAWPRYINDERLIKAIVQAYYEIENEKRQKQIDEKQVWRKKIGMKDQIITGPKLKCYILNFINDLFLFPKIMFIKKQDVREGMATTGLIKMILCLFFSILKWLLLSCAIIWLFYGIFEAFLSGRMAPELIGLGFAAFVFSRLFRIAAVEVESMEDKEYLVAIFSGITSFAAVIIAVIALLKK